MNLPEIENRTAFTFAPLFLTDEDGRPLAVLVTRATLAIEPDGELRVAEEQMAINPAGEFWFPEKPGSYRYEPDVAFVKPGTDVVLVGNAVAARSGTTVTDVGLRVGPVQKLVKVFGDRYWVKGVTGPRMTVPQPFDRIPLCYERAFGGWDRSHADPAQHTFEPRNPHGTGFRTNASYASEEVRLPNIEDPEALISDWRDRPAPAGFGFTSHDWQPRAALAGTYDAAWSESRKPLLPVDFDRRFFSGGSTGLVASEFLNGNEPVVVLGCTATGRLDFTLPGIGPIRYMVRLRNQSPSPLVANMDTIVVDADALLVHLTWRAHLPLSVGAHQLQHVEIISGH